MDGAYGSTQLITKLALTKRTNLESHDVLRCAGLAELILER